MKPESIRLIASLVIAVCATVSCAASKAAETEQIRITPRTCNFVESISQSVAVLQQNFDDKETAAWVAGSMDESKDDDDVYLAHYMTESAVANIRQTYNSDEIKSLAKLLPRYSKLELLGVKMKQFCALNENALYEVPKR